MGNPTFHMSVLALATDNGYRLSDDEFRSLITVTMKAGRVSAGCTDTYFRGLLRRAKDIAETGEATSDMDATKAAHERLTELAKEAVITDDIKPDAEDSSEEKARKTRERQSRMSFARSSGAVLTRYLKAGGTLADLDPVVHGKAAVERMARDMEAEAAEAKGENTPEAKVAKRLASLLTALNQVTDPAKRTVLRDACIKTLEDGVKVS